MTPPNAVAALITAQRLERVPADLPSAQARLSRAEDKLAAARKIATIDVEIAFVTAYDATRIAVTAHMSTDVASSPLLWVVPLAFYLLTFVIVFQTRPVIPHRFALAAQPFLVALLVAVQTFSEIDYIFFVLATAFEQ